MSVNHISLSGLMAAKAAMDATAQNVANVNTPGYSRQEVVLGALNDGGPSQSRAGTGVEVSGVRRFSSMFANAQLWLSESKLSYADTLSSAFHNVEDLIGESVRTVATAMDDFFGGLYDASVEPQSIALRQQVIAQAEATALEFNALSSSIDRQSLAIKNQFEGDIELLNNQLQQIAELNLKIERLIGQEANPSAAQDQRDILIKDVSQLIEVRVEELDRGSINLSLIAGEPLVVGGTASILEFVPNVAQPDALPVVITFANTPFEIQNNVGGSLGAQQTFREERLTEYSLLLDEMATHLHDAVNTQLQLGQDLDGATGAAVVPLFNITDAANAALTIETNPITPRELAFSAVATAPDPLTPGNGENLLALVDIRDQSFAFTSMGNVTLSGAYDGLLSNVAILTRQSNNDAEANRIVHSQAVASRDSISAVSSDEEAANLMAFSNAYQANMKVMSVMDQLFEELMHSL